MLFLARSAWAAPTHALHFLTAKLNCVLPNSDRGQDLPLHSAPWHGKLAAAARLDFSFSVHAPHFLWWGFTPAPGFGGPPLSTVELEAAGLSTADAPGAFAFRVQYLVTWGDNRRFGQAAAKAGTARQGDASNGWEGRRKIGGALRRRMAIGTEHGIPAWNLGEAAPPRLRPAGAAMF